jgi:hypothetical protein
MMMHQYEGRPRRAPGWILPVLLCAGACAQAATVKMTAPTAEMMVPIDGIVEFMTRLPTDRHPDVFVDHDLAIVENFPPFLFRGATAAARWEQGFRRHAAEDDYTELAVKFGPARDFSVSGDRAYFCLPTTWTGLTHGRPFEEHGAWAFVVQRGSNGWRILAYGWGETAHAEPGP